MFIASVAHVLAFPVDPYKIPERQNWLVNIASAANVSDLHSEVRQHYQNFFGKIKNSVGNTRVKNNENKTNDTIEPDDNTNLLSDDELSKIKYLNDLNSDILITFDFIELSRKFY